jgi:hypothetical protein
MILVRQGFRRNPTKETVAVVVPAMSALACKRQKFANAPR